MKNVEIQLRCDTESALQMLKDQTDPPSGFRLIRIMKDPWFWGKIEQNRIKIWPKGPNKDISSAYITGHIKDTEEGSVLVGKIVNDPIIRIPSWLLALAVLVGFPSFGYTMYSFFSLPRHYVPAFLIMIVSIGIMIIGILQRTSEGQEEELEKFLRKVLSKSAISIEIAKHAVSQRTARTSRPVNRGVVLKNAGIIEWTYLENILSQNV